MSVEAILFVIAKEYRSMTRANCKVMTSIIESSTGQFFIFGKIDLVNAYNFEILDIYELKHSLAMPNNSNSRSSFKCCGQNKLDRTKRVCREVHNLIDGG